MKCPYCLNRPKMIEKYKDHISWYECPECHKTYGKPKEENKETNDEDR